MDIETTILEMRDLLNNGEITNYERGVLESMLRQAMNYNRLSEKQMVFYESIAANYSEEAMHEKGEWMRTFVGKKLEDLHVVASYYRAQGTYFLALSTRILEDGEIPSKSEYTKMCENKYAKQVVKEHHAEPLYTNGQLVYARSWCPKGIRSSMGRGGIVLAANVEPISSPAKGAKKYLVLPVGAVHGIVTEERWLKKRK